MKGRNSIDCIYLELYEADISFIRTFIRITDYQAWRYIKSSTVLSDNLLYVIHRANSMRINMTTKSISKLATMSLQVLGGRASLFSMLPWLLPYMCSRNNNAAFPVKWDLKQIFFWCKSSRFLWWNKHD